MPASILIVVDFPAPFGPMYPTNSPSPMVKEMSSTAFRSIRSRLNSVRSEANGPVLGGVRKNDLLTFLASIISHPS
jgi:hypothetical protein